MISSSVFYYIYIVKYLKLRQFIYNKKIITVQNIYYSLLKFISKIIEIICFIKIYYSLFIICFVTVIFSSLGKLLYYGYLDEELLCIFFDERLTCEPDLF